MSAPQSTKERASEALSESVHRAPTFIISAAFALLWIATMLIIYFGGPLVGSRLGSLGAVLALNDGAQDAAGECDAA